MIILLFILCVVISFIGLVNSSSFFMFIPWILYIIYFFYFIIKNLIKYVKNPPKTEIEIQEEINENLKIIANNTQKFK